MVKFSEKTTLGQFATLVGLIIALGAPVTSALIWAGDKKLDEKYATDHRVDSFQQSVNMQLAEVTNTLRLNTEQNTATAMSVDGLALVVLDLQIGDLAAEIFRLEVTKQSADSEWSQMDETNLRTRKQALQDLNTRRAVLFARVMNHQ